MERLDKLLASQGLGTRSGVQKLIRGGGVTVDGAAVRDPSAKCDPERQALTVGGRPLGYKKHLYVMLNKRRASCACPGIPKRRRWWIYSPPP